MAETKTKPTKVSVKDFIAKVPNETRRKDAEVLLKLFEKITGWKAKMWGPTIVGFGKYTYTYDSGHSGDDMRRRLLAARQQPVDLRRHLSGPARSRRHPEGARQAQDRARPVSTSTSWPTWTSRRSRS